MPSSGGLQGGIGEHIPPIFEKIEQRTIEQIKFSNLKTLRFCIVQMPFPKILQTLLRNYYQLAGPFRSKKYDLELINDI